MFIFGNKKLKKYNRRLLEENFDLQNENTDLRIRLEKFHKEFSDMFFRKSKIIKAQKAQIETLQRELDRLYTIESKNKNLEKKVRSLKKQIMDLRGY